MKENEAPEKIWVHELSAKELNVPLKEYHIEYTRTDAFIDKACEWLKENIEKYLVAKADGAYYKITIFEDFKKYMKGE